MNQLLRTRQFNGIETFGFEQVGLSGAWSTGRMQQEGTETFEFHELLGCDGACFERSLRHWPHVMFSFDWGMFVPIEFDIPAIRIQSLSDTCRRPWLIGSCHKLLRELRPAAAYFGVRPGDFLRQLEVWRSDDDCDYPGGRWDHLEEYDALFPLAHAEEPFENLRAIGSARVHEGNWYIGMIAWFCQAAIANNLVFTLGD